MTPVLKGRNAQDPITSFVVLSFFSAQRCPMANRIPNRMGAWLFFLVPAQAVISKFGITFGVGCAELEARAF